MKFVVKASQNYQVLSFLQEANIYLTPTPPNQKVKSTQPITAQPINVKSPQQSLPKSDLPKSAVPKSEGKKNQSKNSSTSLANNSKITNFFAPKN